MDNRALLDAFRQGDAAALEKVYHTYVSEVAQLMKSGFGEKHSGTHIRGISDLSILLDCLQDVFMKAFTPSARESYDGIRPYRAYLMTIARNRLIDHWRAYRRDPVAGADTVVTEDYLIEQATIQTQLSETENEERRLHWKQCLSATDRYFASLDTRTQQFVTMRFRQELPLLDVARRLKMTRWKARELERKLQINLKKYLQREGLLK